MLKRVSQSTIRRTLNYWLNKPPSSSINLSGVNYVVCDGSFLNGNKGIYAIMDAQRHQIIKGAYGVKEGSKELLWFYSELKDRGLEPKYATVDGNTAQIKRLEKVWPSIKIQRCIVHVQRQGLSWCRRNPKRTEAKHLRDLFLDLTTVRTKQQSQDFINSVYAWENRFGNRIESSPNRGWVFSDLLRARSMLLKALPNLFHYIDDPNIARSTNLVEGYFSRLKEHYRLHRGLSIHNRKNYFQWYFYLKQK